MSSASRLFPAIFLLATVASGATSSATAQERWLLVRDEPSRRMYLDTTSVRKASDTTHIVWFLIEYEQTQNEDWGSYVRIRARFEIECSMRQWRQRSIGYYDRAGAVVYSDPFTDPDPWHDLVPDTVGESVILSTCRFLKVG